MLLFDYRLIEGQPLHYYYKPYPDFPDTMDQMKLIREDLGALFSTQSDSDDSISSIEVSPKPIRARSVIQHTPKINEVRCGWKSCGISFDSLDQLATHISKIHTSSGPGGLYYCGWEGCSRNGKGFNARYKMLAHVRTHTNEKPHQCYQCDKSFSRAENLKIHSRSHSGEKPYVCPFPGCKKAYSNSSDRFKHTRTHQVKKPYQCKIPGCPKRYTDPSSLRKHVKTFKHLVHKVDENVKNNSIAQEGHSCDCADVCCGEENEVIYVGVLEYKEKSPFGFFTPEQEMDVDVPLDLSINRRVV